MTATTTVLLIGQIGADEAGACWWTTPLLAKCSKRKGLIQRLAEFRHALPCRLMITMGVAIHLSMVASFRSQARTITSVGLVLCEIIMNLMIGQRVARGHVLRS